MLEKFTEKALNIVTTAQKYAKELSVNAIYPELLLLAFQDVRTCFSTKLIAISKISFNDIKKLAIENLKNKKALKVSDTVNFSEDSKIIMKTAFDLAKKYKNPSITTEHLFLASMLDRKSRVVYLLEDLGFNTDSTKQVLVQLLDKKSKKGEQTEDVISSKSGGEEYSKVLSIFEELESRTIFERAVAKLTASHYEILGTEQIIQSMLEDSNLSLTQVLQNYGINLQTYTQKLEEITSRTAEFEEKQIIFTPNAFKMILVALETAKELGEATVRPEHILLGMLKLKSGIAYNIFKALKINDDNLAHNIIKPIEKQMPETLTILRLAKNEARRLGKNVVGSELILLGIIAESVGIGAVVLSKLGITINETRKEVENIIGYGNKYSDSEILFSTHAKKILELAAEKAKKHGLEKISSANLLWAITKQPSCLAMKILQNLGVDTVEIKQGILKELEQC